MISYEIPDVVVAEQKVSLSSAVVVVVVDVVVEEMTASNVYLAVAETMATTAVDVVEMTAVASVVVAETSFAVAAETLFAVVVAETSFVVAAAAEKTNAAEIFVEGFEPFVALADETLAADVEIAEHETFVVEHTLDDPVVDVMFEVVLVEMGPSFVAHACKVQIKKR